MTDVLPVVFVGADEDLAIKLIWRHGERGHVGRKLEESRQTFCVDEAEAARKRSRRDVLVRTGQDEAPLAKTRDVDVIRIGSEASFFERFSDAPERVAGGPAGGAFGAHGSRA